MFFFLQIRQQVLQDEIAPLLIKAVDLSSKQREKYSTKECNLPIDVEKDILALEAANISVDDAFERRTQELEDAREQREEFKARVIMVKKILEETTEEVTIIDIPASKRRVEVRIKIN